MLGAVIYLLSPIDLLPEWVFPVVGYLDDFAFLWMALRWLLRSGTTEVTDAGDEARRSPGARD